jgi:hypothetical protein
VLLKIDLNFPSKAIDGDRRYVKMCCQNDQYVNFGGLWWFLGDGYWPDWLGFGKSNIKNRSDIKLSIISTEGQLDQRPPSANPKPSTQ